MFMNSPNHDKADPDNNEASKFAVVDRYMLNQNQWDQTLEEIDRTQEKVKWEDKKEKVYWRGSTSGMN